MYGSCLAARISKLVGGMCSMLQYGIGICCYAFIYFFFFDCFCPFLFHTLKKKSGIDKSVEWSMVSACPSLACFFNRGNTEGTNFSKFLCLSFVYVLLYVNLCRDWFCGF